MSTNRKVSLTNDGVLELYEAEVNGTNCITMKAPSSFVGNYTMTLPTALGAETDLLTMSSAGQVAVLPIGTPGYYLKVNSSGNGYDWGVIAASLQAAYNGGQSITTGSGQITLTNTAANEVMVINQSANDEAIRIEHTNTGSPNALQITNAGTGRGIDIVANGNCSGIRVAKSNVGNASCLVVANSGTGNGLNISQVGVAQGIYVSQAGNSHAADLQKSSTGNAAALKVVNSGTGAGVQIDQTGNGYGLQVSKVNTGGQQAVMIGSSASTGALVVTQSGTNSGPAVTIQQAATGDANAVQISTAAVSRHSIVISHSGSQTALWMGVDSAQTGIDITKSHAGVGDCLVINNSGSGYDIRGTGATWNVDKAGNAAFNTVASVPFVYLTESNTQVTVNNTAGWTDLLSQSITITSPGANSVLISAHLETQSNTDAISEFRLVRDSTEIMPGAGTNNRGCVGHSSSGAHADFIPLMSQLQYVDKQSAGTYTYKVQGRHGHNWNGANSALTLNYINMIITKCYS